MNILLWNIRHYRTASNHIAPAFSPPTKEEGRQQGFEYPDAFVQRGGGFI
jgi:hypothetical protein